MSEASMTRRNYLRLSAAAVALAGLSACDSDDESDSGETTEGSASDSSSTATLGLDYTEVYSTDYQEAVMAELDELKASGTYAPDDPLVEQNPFATNTTGLYVYFCTDEPAKVSYEVTAPGTGYPDFSAEVYQDEEYQTEHEFQVLGLIPEGANMITFNMEYEDGSTETTYYSCVAPVLMGQEDVQLDEAVIADEALDLGLGNGLYVVLGNDSQDQDFMYYYDVEGVIRAEIPIIGYRSHRLLFKDGLMYFSISQSKICAMNRLGQVERVYKLGDYDLHHDYVFDGDQNLIILGTDSTDEDSVVEDRILKLDLESGEVTQLLDMADLMGDYKETTEHESVDDDGDWDWVHFNTIQWVGDGSVILSSRETSSIMKVNDLEGTPSLAWMIGPEDFWAGTGYEGYLLAAEGDFGGTGGQHCVTIDASDDLEDGQVRLLMFDNNYGYSPSRPDYDWSTLKDDVHTLTPADDEVDEGDYSYCTVYVVDESAGTYSLESTFAVPYSAYVSSVQRVGENDEYVLVDSGGQGLIGIYTADGELLQQWESMINYRYLYRVLYYDFKGFYFAE